MQRPSHPTEFPESAFLDTLVRAKEGDEAAINQLFTQFYDQVSRMVHARLANDMRRSRPWLNAQFSTGDVVQEVFSSVLGDLSAFAGRTERSFAGYLAMVVRNRIVDVIRFHEADRRDGRRRASLDGPVQAAKGSEDPAEMAVNDEAVLAFEAAMARLDQRERLLVEARLEGSVSFRELTDYLGYSSESAARRAYFGARAKLAVHIHGATDVKVDPEQAQRSHGAPPAMNQGPEEDQ